MKRWRAWRNRKFQERLLVALRGMEQIHPPLEVDEIGSLIIEGCLFIGPDTAIHVGATRGT